LGRAAPLRSVFAGTSFGPPRRRLVSTITGHLVTAEDDIARLLARQVTRPVLFAQAMAEAATGADLIVTAGPDAGLGARATECTGVPAVPIPTALPSGHSLPSGSKDQRGRLGAALAHAIAALFAAGALTDLTPFLAAAGEGGRCGGPSASGDTLASRPAAGCVPRMRCAQEASPSGPALAARAMSSAGAGNPARSVT
jgi:hypothetical protein